MPDLTTAADAAPALLTDKVVLLRGGQTFTITLAELLAVFQGAVTAAQNTLLGRTSATPGGPQAISLGAGLGIGAEELVATGADHTGFAVLSAMDLNAEFVVNSAGTPARIPFALVRGLLLAAGQPLVNVTWVTAGQPAPSLGGLGDFAHDFVSVPSSLVVWQKHAVGWGAIGQIALTDVSTDFASAANSDLAAAL